METLGNFSQKIDEANRNASKSECDFVSFFTKKDVFSNFFECSFDIDGRKYNTTEQFLFSQKALHVGDNESAEKIMRNREARTCKLIGEQNVKWTESIEKWRDFAVEKLRIANMAKYSQNETLRRILFETYPKTLVETNPSDSFLGVALKKGDKDIQDPSK